MAAPVGAQPRPEAPWIPADSAVTANTDGTWKVVDVVDRPFVDDPAILGVWTSVDFASPARFNPFARSFPGDLYWKSVEFFPSGFAKGTFGTFVNTTVRWTSGWFLAPDNDSPTASRYQLQTIAGKDYLFVEWKSGDYTLRGQEPGWYVFSR